MPYRNPPVATARLRPRRLTVFLYSTRGANPHRHRNYRTTTPVHRRACQPTLTRSWDGANYAAAGSDNSHQRASNPTGGCFFTGTFPYREKSAPRPPETAGSDPHNTPRACGTGKPKSGRGGTEHARRRSGAGTAASSPSQSTHGSTGRTRRTGPACAHPHHSAAKLRTTREPHARFRAR